MEKKLAVLMLIALMWSACQTRHIRGQYYTAHELIYEIEQDTVPIYLKVHFENGEVIILGKDWFIDSSGNCISGYGERYDAQRRLVEVGYQDVDIDSVVLFETNKELGETERTRIGALTLIGALDIGMAIYCIADPKACWGSCPTFYIHPELDLHHSDAEGFSSAILPCEEYRDIDDLNYWESSTDFEITMKNEALETHVVREVELLAIPSLKNQTVLHGSDDQFYICDTTFTPILARAEEGDILAELSSLDKVERMSLSDSNYLARKEEVFLEFNNSESGEIGLDISFRHSLMSTYLFYSFIGYMGHQASDYFALMQTDSSYLKRLKNGVEKELGGIDIYQWSEEIQDWIPAGSVSETGPIAINRQFVPLPYQESNTRIKLVMSKGLWRLDHVQIASIERKVEPLVLSASSVYKNNTNDSVALRLLEPGGAALTTYPGESYTIHFKLPQGGHQLFLSSKGYYLEWLRKEWLDEENLSKLIQLNYRPKAYLRNEAMSFKNYEEIMESQFWNSRIKNQIFSYD